MVSFSSAFITGQYSLEHPQNWHNNGNVMSQTYHDKLSFYKSAMIRHCSQASCDMETDIQTENYTIPWL